MRRCDICGRYDTLIFHFSNAVDGVYFNYCPNHSFNEVASYYGFVERVERMNKESKRDHNWMKEGF